MRIFGHPIDESNPSQISEVAEGDENGDESFGKVCPVIIGNFPIIVINDNFDLM